MKSHNQLSTTITNPEIIDWLLQGDPAIRWQVLRDLLNSPAEIVESERRKIITEGWGKRLLDLQGENGLWANGLYGPKWTSTTYTMLTLWRFGLPQDNPQARQAAMILLEKGFYKDDGISYFKSIDYGEQCVTGMILTLCSYFQIDDERVDRLAKFLIRNQMPDDGWNCNAPKGATHASVHTTITVLEALHEYGIFRKTYEFQKHRDMAWEFLQQHRLFRSHRTGEVINPQFLRFPFPPRWHYDILRALDYWQRSRTPYDPRMDDAIEILLKKRRKDGRWNLFSRYSGRIYFEIEKAGQPSRWNTLRALRILKWLEQVKT